jgi:hypothetical protein
MMNEIPYCSYMIFDFFGKRKRFSHKTGNSLSHRIIESFNMTCLSAFLSDSTMPLGRKNLFIRCPEIRITDSALPVNARQRIPQSRASFAITAAHIHPDNFFRINIFCQPNPYLIAFVPDKGPHSISFNGQATFRLILHLFRNFFIFFIHIILQPTFGNICNPDYPGRREFFYGKSADQFFYFLRYSPVLRILSKLSAALFAFKPLFSIVNFTVFYNVFTLTVRVKTLDFFQK